jgi:formamidopyrimidine-DNA glycosylase
MTDLTQMTVTVRTLQETLIHSRILVPLVYNRTQVHGRASFLLDTTIQDVYAYGRYFCIVVHHPDTHESLHCCIQPGAQGHVVVFPWPWTLQPALNDQNGATVTHNAQTYKHIQFALKLVDGRVVCLQDSMRVAGVFITPTALATQPDQYGIALLHTTTTTEKTILALMQKCTSPVCTFFTMPRFTGIDSQLVIEALWACKIHPSRPVCSLPPETQATLIHLLQASARTIVSTVWKSPYPQSLMHNGSILSLRVWEHHGRPCPRCSTRIIRCRMHRTILYYCPTCQQ